MSSSESGRRKRCDITELQKVLHHATKVGEQAKLLMGRLGGLLAELEALQKKKDGEEPKK